MQTRTDIEVLVVGDGCTDDSEAVVASFGDPRFHWHNLPKNFGSQYAPNNCGIELAKGKWIAYLGQDDVWHPRHLEACLNAARESDSNFIVSVTVMYGPPGSGWRSVSGLLVDDTYTRGDFMPPSSWMHRKAIARRIGGWKAPETTAFPVDCTFLMDAAEAGSRIGSTNELTVFKFNAAWRRNAYRLKPTDEQEAIIARIERGEDFRQRELVDVLRAVGADRYMPVRIPEPVDPSGLSDFKRNRQHKGAEERYPPEDLLTADQMRRLEVEEAGHFQWYPKETHPSHGAFRWTGPSARVAATLPVLFDRDLLIRIHVIAAIAEDAFVALKLTVQDVEHPYNTELTPEGTRILVCICRYTGSVPRALDIGLDVGKTRRPRDVGMGEDRRWLGLAVNWIEVGPA
jgi:hypothetical protein